MKFILSLITVLFLAANTIACSCAQKGELTKEDVEKTDLIFTGKAVKVELDRQNYKRIITFEVKKVLKGKESTEEYTIVTNLDGSSCGLGVEEGEEWFVFATESNGVFRTNMCSRSTKISKPVLDKKTLGKAIYKAEKKNFKVKRKQFKKERKFIANYTRQK